MRGTQRLVASVLYGSGLRLSEALQLRVKDLDLEGRELRVHGAKGGRARVSVVPGTLVGRLGDQIEKRRALHERDLMAGFGWATARPSARTAVFTLPYPRPRRTLIASPQLEPCPG